MKYKEFLMEDALEALIDYRGKTPKKSNEGIETLSAKSVKNGYIDYSECYYISPEEYDRFMVRGMPQKGDILLTTEAPMGMVAKLDKDGVAIAQRLLTLRGKEGILDNDYLMYYLQSPVGQHKLTERETGTTVTGIKQAEFRKILIEIPDIETQRKIAAVLNSIDQAIDINKKIIDNLNREVKSLVAMWLCDYSAIPNVQLVDSELGYVPEGWKIYKFDDLVECISGYSYKGTELRDSNVGLATIKNFNRNGGFKTDGYKDIVPSDKMKETQVAKLFDVVVAHTDLTQNADIIGNAEMVLSTDRYEKIVISMDLVKVTTKSSFTNRILLGIMQTSKFKNHCLGYVNGTTVLHLSKKAIPEYRVALPCEANVLQPLDNALKAIFETLADKMEENRKLLSMRELLLPKLLLGKIEVDNIEI